MWQEVSVSWFEKPVRIVGILAEIQMQEDPKYKSEALSLDTAFLEGGH
jgi:hypothetical protein